MIQCNFFLLQTVDREGVSANPLIYNVQILPTWGNGLHEISRARIDEAFHRRFELSKRDMAHQRVHAPGNHEKKIKKIKIMKAIQMAKDL